MHFKVHDILRLFVILVIIVGLIHSAPMRTEGFNTLGVVFTFFADLIHSFG